jgi:phosphoglycolate phosphatase
MIKAIIFDLDGTLLDTLTDIKESVNTVLARHGFPTHELDAYKYFIGNGIEVLTRKALPADVSDADFKKYFAEVNEEYSRRQTLKTRPYEGIPEMLAEMQKRGLALTILSNKPHEFAVPTVQHFFPDTKFEVVFGSRPGVERKPAPDAVFEILDILELSRTEVLYVGDTATDMLTAKAAGLRAVGVSWGFRTVDELQKAGADHIIDRPEELLYLL